VNRAAGGAGNGGLSLQIAGPGVAVVPLSAEMVVAPAAAVAPLHMVAGRGKVMVYPPAAVAAGAGF